MFKRNPLPCFLKRVKFDCLDLELYGCGSYFWGENWKDIDLWVSPINLSKLHMDKLKDLADSFTVAFGIRIHVFCAPIPNIEDLILVYDRGTVWYGDGKD